MVALDRPRVLRDPRSRLSCCIAAVLLAVPAKTAQADGEFLQFDISETTASAVLSVDRGPFRFGANHVRYQGGQQSSLNLLYSFPMPETAPTVRLGPSLARVENDAERDETELGLKLTVDRWMPTEYGSLYLLAEANTVEDSAFALVQFGLSGPALVLEISHGRSDSYSETTFAVAKGVAGTPAALRAGYRFDAEELFLGVSINTF